VSFARAHGCCLCAAPDIYPDPYGTPSLGFAGIIFAIYTMRACLERHKKEVTIVLVLRGPFWAFPLVNLAVASLVADKVETFRNITGTRGHIISHLPGALSWCTPA
jgi:hypothetical protein